MTMRVCAFAPASVGNVTCGFDILGMALQAPGDVVSVSFSNNNEVRIVSLQGDGGKLSRAAAENTGGIAVLAMQKFLSEQRGVDIAIEKNMPLGSGMGSSAATAVAAALAYNHLLGNPLSKQELIPFVLEAEAFGSGSVHGDNAIPALLGGIVLIRSCEPLDIVCLPVPEQLHYALSHPDLVVLTKTARQLIPQQINMHDTLAQMGNIAAFVDALHRADYAQLASSLHDRLAEPYRTPLIRGFDAVKEAALTAGALHCGISGSGPSVFSLCNDAAIAQRAAEAMQNAFEQTGIDSEIYYGKVNTQGAYILPTPALSDI